MPGLRDRKHVSDILRLLDSAPYRIRGSADEFQAGVCGAGTGWCVRRRAGRGRQPRWQVFAIVRLDEAQPVAQGHGSAATLEWRPDPGCVALLGAVRT